MVSWYLDWHIALWPCQTEILRRAFVQTVMAFIYFYFAWYLFLDLTLWILSCLTPCVEAYKSKWFTRILSKQSICDVTHRGMRAYRWKYFSAVRIHIRCETGFQIQCVTLELALITPWHNCLQNKRRVMSYETWVMSINQGSYQHFFYLLLKVTLMWNACYSKNLIGILTMNLTKEIVIKLMCYIQNIRVPFCVL